MRTWPQPVRPSSTESQQHPQSTQQTHGSDIKLKAAASPKCAAGSLQQHSSGSGWLHPQLCSAAVRSFAGIYNNRSLHVSSSWPWEALQRGLPVRTIAHSPPLNKAGMLWLHSSSLQPRPAKQDRRSLPCAQIVSRSRLAGIRQLTECQFYPKLRAHAPAAPI